MDLPGTLKSMGYVVRYTTDDVISLFAKPESLVGSAERLRKKLVAEGQAVTVSASYHTETREAFLHVRLQT